MGILDQGGILETPHIPRSSQEMLLRRHKTGGVSPGFRLIGQLLQQIFGQIFRSIGIEQILLQKRECFNAPEAVH